MSMTLKDFHACVERSAEPHGCWLWLGGRDRAGYGWVYYDGRTVGAHRVAWEMHSGKSIPEGVIVRHVCDNPPCVNPAHLLLGTKGDNTSDMYKRGRTLAGIDLDTLCVPCGHSAWHHTRAKGCAYCDCKHHRQSLKLGKLVRRKAKTNAA